MIDELNNGLKSMNKCLTNSSDKTFLLIENKLLKESIIKYEKKFKLTVSICTIIFFFIGYSLSFVLAKSNIDYSDNHIETFENVKVEYSNDYGVRIIQKDGKEIIIK